MNSAKANKYGDILATNGRKQRATNLAINTGVCATERAVTSPAASPNIFYNTSEDDFHNLKASINADVCGSGHEMPQAEHVMRKFWNSGALAYLDLGLGLNSACKP